MDLDDRMGEYIAAGERNKATMLLVNNWCRHVRIENHGGIGLVQMQTGLPIGHHGLSCEHAGAGGIQAWDLGHAAIDFYDRNCINCKHRIGVGFPNISTLVAERDAKRARAREEHDAWQRAADAARAARREARQRLRSTLPAPSAGLVDCLEELDQEKPTEDATEKLLAAAALAPEAFTSDLIAHLFGLLESRESWFVETGLRLLEKLRSNPVRLAECAMKSLQYHSAVMVAARIVERQATCIDAGLIDSALPALIGLASPEPAPFSYEREIANEPLRAIYRAHPQAVEVGIAKLFASSRAHDVSMSAAAIVEIGGIDPTIAVRMSRTVCAKLTRAKHFIEPRRTGYLGDDSCIYRMQDALYMALCYATEETDSLMCQFFKGATHEGERRLIQVYSRAIQPRGRWDAPPEKATPVSRVALRRLVDALSGDHDAETRREIHHTLLHKASDHPELARHELTALLGAALLMDDQLKQFDALPKPANGWLEVVEHRNMREQIVDLQRTLLKWAANGAAGSRVHAEEYISVLQGVPPEREEMRAAFISCAHAMMRSPETLNVVLPHLYAALVGASVYGRGAAAKAIGKMGSQGKNHLPHLVYEAFTTLLTDRFVYVHSMAIQALEEFELPESLDDEARAAIGGLINSYFISRDRDEFLIRCIRLLLGRYATKTSKRGKLGELVLAMLDKLKPEEVRYRFRWLSSHLKERPEFVPLVLKLLATVLQRDEQAEELLDCLSDVPAPSIVAHKEKIVAITKTQGIDGLCTARLVETLTRAGAYEGASEINDYAFERIPNTTEQRPSKLYAGLQRIAARFELALAQGQLSEVPALADEWRQTALEIEEDKKKYAKQRSAFPDFPLSN